MTSYFPCLYGTFLAGRLGDEIILLRMGTANVKLFLLSFVRDMLCTWNDVFDQDINRQIARTRNRPIARGAISTTQAVIWTLIQIVLVLVTFLTLPRDCFVSALPFLGLHILYPFAKRVTHHPQLILGFAHSLGVFVSFPALGQSIPLSLDTRCANAAGTFCLSAAIVFWILGRLAAGCLSFRALCLPNRCLQTAFALPLHASHTLVPLPGCIAVDDDAFFLLVSAVLTP